MTLMSGMCGPHLATRHPQPPLRALSTFNYIRHLAQQISQITACSYNMSSSVQDILYNLQQQQAAILQHRPYNRDSHATPPLLILHLTSAFTTLSLIRKFESVSCSILDLCVRTTHDALDMLDHYVEMTGGAGSSPLVYIFALQCQQSLCIVSSVLSSTQGEALKKRVDALLRLPKPNGQIDEGDWSRHAISSVSATQSDEQNLSLIPISATQNTQISSATLESLPEPPDISLLDLPSTDTPVPVGGDPEEYDALFEEMMLVGSFSPCR
jgi:hypothetical protein